MWQLNVMSYVRAIRAVVPGMRERGYGRIVNVSSTAGKRPSTGMPDYSVTKAAVLSLSRLVADVYAKDGILLQRRLPGSDALPAWLGPGGLADQVAERPARRATRCSRSVGARPAARPHGRARGDRGRGRVPVLRPRELRDRRRVERRRRHRADHHLSLDRARLFARRCSCDTTSAWCGTCRIPHRGTDRRRLDGRRVLGARRRARPPGGVEGAHCPSFHATRGSAIASCASRRSPRRSSIRNIVPIHAVGEADGVLFIAMRYVEGRDFRADPGEVGRLDPERAVGLPRQVASALDAAHARGLVHRDVKPANILISRPARRAASTPTCATSASPSTPRPSTSLTGEPGDPRHRRLPGAGADRREAHGRSRRRLRRSAACSSSAWPGRRHTGGRTRSPRCSRTSRSRSRRSPSAVPSCRSRSTTCSPRRSRRSATSAIRPAAR